MAAGEIETARLRLPPLDAGTVEALVAGDLAQASRRAGCPLTREFCDSLGNPFLGIQLRLLQEHPGQQAWCVRAIVGRQDGTVVGHCGFHGPPAVIGRTELGYHVFARYRARGYATEAAGGLLDWAHAHGYDTVIASIASTNVPSLRVARRLGFHRTGATEGHELLLEHSRTSGQTPGR